MRVGALQLDVQSGAVEENLARVERGLQRAAEAGLALVVLPEMWPTSFPSSGGPDADLLARSDAALERVRLLSGELRLVVAGSAFGRVAGSARCANRLHLFEHGRALAGYDKVHLFSPTAEPEAFAAGELPPRVVESALGKLAGVVCYDLRFPELVRVAFREGVELLVVCAQWPSARRAHWRALCAGRAAEAQAFVVAANRTGAAEVGRRRLRLEFPGASLVVAPSGEVLAEGRAQEELVSAEVELEEARRLQREVPVARDQRLALYRAWLEPGAGEPSA